MAGFVRAAAKEKAVALVERETRVFMSTHDFTALMQAPDVPFKTNAPLKRALAAAGKIRRA